MSNTYSVEERRQLAGAMWIIFAILTIPVFLPGIFSSSRPLASRLVAVGITSVLLVGLIYHQRKYGFQFVPKWKWQAIGDASPDLSLSESFSWHVRLIGFMALIVGIWLGSCPFVTPVSKGADNFTLPFAAVWLGTWLITSGLYFALHRSGIFVFKDHRTVVAWWGLAWPMFRKEFPFDEFTDTSIHLYIPRDFTDRRHWRVWLREPSYSVAIRARDKEDARQIGMHTRMI